MNERIKEFAKQTLSKDQFGLWLAGDEDIEKFVGLIVKEYSQHLTNIGQDYAREQLEKHFGVDN
jgi:hypothetical protein